MICLWLSLAAADRAFAEIVVKDDFEFGINTLRWEDINSTRGEVAIDNRPENIHAGHASLRLTAMENGGQTAQAHATTWFMPGYDQLYYRFYAKFSEDFDEGYYMHWTSVGGSSIDNRYSAMGKAGLKPNGVDFFFTAFEPGVDWGNYPPPGALNFYTYYPDMEAAPGGYYWGNSFQPMVPFVIERGRWYCFEFMVKANTPGSYDGEQAFWMDGVKIYHARNIRWRNSDVLRLNFFWFSVYIHESRQDNTCWYDDLVISTEYVGPLEPPKPATPMDYDFQRDGRFGLDDLLLLLKMKRDEPDDGRADYDRDGKSTILDVIKLLFDSRKTNSSQ